MIRSFLLWGVLLMTAPLHADDLGLRQVLSIIAQKAAVKATKDKKVAFDEGGFAGTFQALDPEKSFKTDIRQFALANDAVTTTVQFTGRFRLEGTYARDGATTDFSAEISVDATAMAEAKLVQRGSDFFVRPRVQSLEPKIVLDELKPDSLAGGKDLLTRLLNAAVKKHLPKFLIDINQALEEKKLDL